MEQKTYFLRLEQDDGADELFYPKEVFPFTYEGIDLFSSETEGEWRVTEVKTGYRISCLYTTREEAEQNARDNIDEKTPSAVRKAIKTAVKNTELGLVYNIGLGKWVEP